MTTPPPSPGPYPNAGDPYGYQAPPPPELGGGPRRAAAEQPQSIKQAVLLMWVGAALAVIGGLVSLLVVDVDELIDKASAGSGLDADAGRTVFWASLIFGLTIGAGLWAWMAIMNGKGRKWARAVATVFFAISLVSTISAVFVQPAAPITIVFNVLSLLVGLGALVLMYKPESTAFYEARSHSY